MKESAKVFSADPKSLPKHNDHLIKNKNMLTHLLFIMEKENIHDQDFAQNVLKISYYRYSRLSRKCLHKIKLNKHENIVCGNINKKIKEYYKDNERWLNDQFFNVKKLGQYKRKYFFYNKPY